MAAKLGAPAAAFLSTERITPPLAWQFVPGAKVAMVAKLGRDVFATDMLDNFRRHNVLPTHITQTDAAATGVAPIAVDDSGQNAIIICNGANDLLTVDDVAAAEDVIRGAKVGLLAQV